MLVKMRQTIDVLKSRVTLNLEEIKKNEASFRQILKEGKAVEKADELSALLEKNKALLSENFDYINVQLSMMKFIGRYKDISTKPDSVLKQQEIQEIHNSMDILPYTIEGLIPYNANHPMLFDENFCARLMLYYTENKNYKKIKETLTMWTLGHLN